MIPSKWYHYRSTNSSSILKISCSASERSSELINAIERLFTINKSAISRSPFLRSPLTGKQSYDRLVRREQLAGRKQVNRRKVWRWRCGGEKRGEVGRVPLRAAPDRQTKVHSVTVLIETTTPTRPPDSKAKATLVCPSRHAHRNPSLNIVLLITD